jgi:hypothetical protein
MKKTITLLTLAFGIHVSHAQLISDNFESYNAGALGPQSNQWTTWSGTEGGAEDGVVSTAQAQSGSKSLYLNSNSTNGGPQDVLLNLGQLYNSGILTFECAMYIPAGKQAYINFQSALNPGVTWGLNWNAADGTFSIDDGITPELATGSYPVETWFTFRIEANLTLGVWKALVNGNVAGVWINGLNSVASINFYPHNANARYYVDDVVVDVQPYTLSNVNAVASGLNMTGNIAGQVLAPKASVTNGGTSAITSFTATLNYNGMDYVQNIIGVNIASLAHYTVNFSNVSLVAGNNTATLTISNVNGGADDVSTDNTIAIQVNPIVPATGKMVVGEEGTGTWCQWCPRGAVFMDRFEEDFDGFWIGIAVHNADPMTVATYDAGIGAMVSGYPSAVVDRGTSVDPSNMYNQFYARLQTAPTAFISTTQTYNAATRELTVTVTANFQANASNAYKLACVLTEDGVTGSGSGWSQSNAFANGNNGVMGGYELLPNPVPASMMVYDHVARAIEPSFAGDANSFPATVNAGETHSRTYTFTLPATWDDTKINIIGMMMDPTGRIDNASKFKLADLVGIDDHAMSANSVSLFPNPAGMSTTLVLNLENPTSVEVAVLDINGKTISTRVYDVLSDNQLIEMNTALLQAGVYFVQVSIDGMLITQKLIIE